MRRSTPIMVSIALILTTPGLLLITPVLTAPGIAQAAPEPAPNTVAALIADVAEANQQLSDLGAQVQQQQESVNKALLDVQHAREAAAAAQQRVVASQRGVDDAEAAIVAAQQKFDDYAAARYVTGPSPALVLATNPHELIDGSLRTNTLAMTSQRVMAQLQQAHTRQINENSAARLADQHAQQAVTNAEASQDAAVSALTEAQSIFAAQQAEIDQLAAQRKAAQIKLDSTLRAQSHSAAPSSAAIAARPGAPGNIASPQHSWDSAAPGSDAGPGTGEIPPYGNITQWDTTLPMVPSAFISGDPLQIINTFVQLAVTSVQRTAQMGKNFLAKLGILTPGDSGITNGVIPSAHGSEAIEHVINRAASQLGVPYSWGGGTADGPSNGIDSGSGTVGFDCSGLILYAFAGVGISLPHYSGSQYDMGRKIPTSQMRRGDVIFYGPGGSQHVTLYLGNNQMIEAPYTGSSVKISPVRTSGMTPYVVRYIES